MRGARLFPPSLIAAILALVALLAVACSSAAPAPTAAPAKPAEPTKASAPAATTAPAAAQPTAAPAAAKPEEKPTGKLTILGTPEEKYVQTIAKAFEDKTGIKTSFVRLSSGEATARLQAEKNNPQFSVWWGGPADGFIAAKKQGLLDQYKSPSADKIPAQLKDPENYWTGIYVGSLGFATNKEFMAKKGVKAPESWDDLLKPEYKGQIAMAHPASSGTAYTMLATIVQMNGKDVNKSFDYMKKFHQNVLQYPKTGAAPARMAGTGEVGVGIVFSHDTVAAMEEGYPLELTFPKEGTGYEIGGLGIVKGAKEPVEAKKFYDWALTKEAQEIGPTVKAYQAPTNPDAKPSRPELLKVKLIDYDFQWAGDNKKTLVDRFESEVARAPQ